MLSKSTEVLLHLSLIQNVGPATVFKILQGLLLDRHPELLHVDWSDIAKKSSDLKLYDLYDYSLSDLINKFRLPEGCAKQIHEGLSDTEILDRELDLADKNSVKIVDILSDEYPPLLRQIHVPPIVLYFLGALIDRDARHFAVVGSRAANDYSVHVIQTILPTLISNGWAIVSGGAVGADTMAHEAALNAAGKTVAVLGSGLLCPYPESNLNLFKSIANEGGAIISPFSLKKAPDRGTFPARNRVISGLSLGCLVVQAAAKSGALITAQCALDQGRLVFAVPGPIDDKLSVGCNELIKQGAKLVCNADDILEEFGEHLHCGRYRPAVKVEQQVLFEKDCCEDAVLCELNKISTLDELVVKTGLDFAELQDRLFTLQLEGKVSQNFTGAWERVVK
jgi:DNA processing protein